MGTKSTSPGRSAKKKVTLATLAEHLDLSPATISIVLNETPAARSMRPETRARVRQAARELGYRPNELARSLRAQRSRVVGVVVPRLICHYSNGVVTGLDGILSEQGYSCLTANHYDDSAKCQRGVETLANRQVDGLVLVAAPQAVASEVPRVEVPMVTVGGLGGGDLKISNIGIDHDRAATQALSYLQRLGHREIAFFKGSPDSSDTSDRWRAIRMSAADLNLEVADSRTRELTGGSLENSPTPKEFVEQGYTLGRSMVRDGVRFTALFAFNDLSAIGAMRAFREAGWRIPEDVSVIGFDGIDSSAWCSPSLTTLSQPLESMGQIAGRWILEALRESGAGEAESSAPPRLEPLLLEAKLRIRDSTGPCPAAGPGESLAPSQNRSRGTPSTGSGRR